VLLPVTASRFDESPVVETLTRRHPGFEAAREAALVSTQRDGWRDDGAPIASDRLTPSARMQFAVRELRRFLARDPARRSLGCRLKRLMSRWPNWGALLHDAVDEGDASEMIMKAPGSLGVFPELGVNPRLHVLVGRHQFGQHHL
jgi:hypothetical protein